MKIQIMFYQIISIRGLNFCSSSSAENSPNFAHSLNKPKEQAVTRLLRTKVTPEVPKHPLKSSLNIITNPKTKRKANPQ